MSNQDWTIHAKCRGLDPNIFVPNGPGGNLDPAKAICNGTHDQVVCPVRDACRRYGETNNLIGVWGGIVRSSRTWLAALRSREERLEVPPVVEVPVLVKIKDARPTSASAPPSNGTPRGTKARGSPKPRPG